MNDKEEDGVRKGWGFYLMILLIVGLLIYSQILWIDNCAFQIPMYQSRRCIIAG